MFLNQEGGVEFPHSHLVICDHRCHRAVSMYNCGFIFHGEIAVFLFILKDSPPIGGMTWSNSFMLVRFQMDLIMALSSSLACSKLPVQKNPEHISESESETLIFYVFAHKEFDLAAGVYTLDRQTKQQQSKTINSQHIGSNKSVHEGQWGSDYCIYTKLRKHINHVGSCVPSVLILSAVLTRANRVALKVTVPSLLRGMFMPIRRCGQENAF